MTPLFAYFGPETVLPATSIIATIVGVVLMLGKNSIRWCVGPLLSAIGRGPKAEPATPAPHFKTGAKTRATEAEEAARRR